MPLTNSIPHSSRADNAASESSWRSLIGIIALKTGRKPRWDADREEFPGGTEANRLLSRAARPPWDLI